MKCPRFDLLEGWQDRIPRRHAMPPPLDELGTEVERMFIDIPLGPDGDTSEIRYLRKRWRTAYVRMLLYKDVLAERGSLQLKSTPWQPPVYVLRFRLREDGKVKQKSIHLGNHPSLARMANEVVKKWRIERYCGGDTDEAPEA